MITSTSRTPAYRQIPALGIYISFMTYATREESGEVVRARKSRADLVLDPPMSLKITPSSRLTFTCMIVVTVVLRCSSRRSRWRVCNRSLLPGCWASIASRLSFGSGRGARTRL